MMRMTLNAKRNPYKHQMLLKPFMTQGVFFTNSEAEDEQLKAIRDLEKVVWITKKRKLTYISDYFYNALNMNVRMNVCCTSFGKVR